MHRLFLVFCLLFAVVIISPTETLGDVDCWEALQSEPWGDYTHTHDTTDMPNHSAGSGTHTHKEAYREIQIGKCKAFETRTGQEHEVVEPDPPPPVIEGYTKPTVRDPLQVIGPADIDGNVPPEPKEGEPELFYPIIEIDGVFHGDRSREPYQVSEEAKNAESPEGYRLEDIDGQLFLVPYGDTSKHTPMDESKDVPEQETFIIYTLEVVGGQNYLEPTPFHAHPVSDSTDDSVNTGAGNQDPQDIQDGQNSLGGEGEIFASLDGKFYQVTSNPAIPLQVTEYMVRTWGDGQSHLPQWIELYNPNALAVNLVGYEFSYVFKKQTHSIQLSNPTRRRYHLSNAYPASAIQIRRHYRFTGLQPKDRKRVETRLVIERSVGDDYISNRQDLWGKRKSDNA